jgi:hypothetical protein
MTVEAKSNNPIHQRKEANERVAGLGVVAIVAGFVANS